jgi:drug/metabolite transporter (DMT)-like permease
LPSAAEPYFIFRIFACYQTMKNCLIRCRGFFCIFYLFGGVISAFREEMEENMNSSRSRQKKELIGVLCLLAAAVIWGSAFSAQSIGAEYVDAYTFLAGRSWIAVAAMLPVIVLTDQLKKRSSRQPEVFSGAAAAPSASERASSKSRKTLWMGGLLCGFLLFAASAAQQIGIAHTTTAKSGFITALYVVLVPLISLFVFRKGQGLKIWLCVILSVAGLYLLCMRGRMTLGYGDAMTLLSAVLFALQIIAIGRFVSRTDAVRLSALQFFFEAVFATAAMLILEHPGTDAVLRALPALLYVGLLSSAAGYTLQTIGQKDLNPTVASLLMSLESVFSAVFGWIILGQALTLRELLGCGLMFLGILLSQLPLERVLRRRETRKPQEGEASFCETGQKAKREM